MDDAQLECEVVHSVIENKYYRAEIAYVFVDATTLAMEQLGDMSSRCDAVIVIDDARVKSDSPMWYIVCVCDESGWCFSFFIERCA